MAYNGSVGLLSGIKQVNNGKYPLIESSAVYVDDDIRLNDVINEVASKDDVLQMKTLIIDALELLKIALQSGDIQQGVAILDQAILDLNTLGGEIANNGIVAQIHDKSISLTAVGNSSLSYSNSQLTMSNAGNVTYNGSNNSVIIGQNGG